MPCIAHYSWARPIYLSLSLSHSLSICINGTHSCISILSLQDFLVITLMASELLLTLLGGNKYFTKPHLLFGGIFDFCVSLDILAPQFILNVLDATILLHDFRRCSVALQDFGTYHFLASHPSIFSLL